MKRQIIKIDDEKCNGCGLCVTACHEGAIGIVNGKAKLLRDDYCDGLGNCLPACPVNAIAFEEREAAAYNEDEVNKNMENKKSAQEVSAGCPGSMPKDMRAKEEFIACGCPGAQSKTLKEKALETEAKTESPAVQSELSQWPVQIKLVPVNAPYIDNAHILIAADCAAYAYAAFHKDFIKGRITLIGCPKLDNADYSEKLTEIIRNNDIKSITVARMEVPCCSGLAEMAKRALIKSGKMIPWSIKIISVDGDMRDL